MKQWKRDALLIVVILFLAALLWLFLRPGEQGAYAAIIQNGVEVERLSLARDRSITISTDNGGFNVLVVEDGTIYVYDANCGNHDCIRKGRIARTREQIACLPHGLVIEIIGGESSDIDAFTH